MNDISDPVQAATAPDPYPYYAALRAADPLHYDERLKLWVAAGSAAVCAVLQHPALHVRPAAEPVPRAIAGSAAGAVFGRLARMNDGAAHQAARRALQGRLAGIDASRLMQCAREHAARYRPDDAPALDAWVMQVPLLAMAESLGVAQPVRQEVAALVQDFVACLSPLSPPQRLAAAAQAAQRLVEHFEGGLGSWAGEVPDGLPAGVWVANLVGLLSQTCDATAGLLGNAVVALAREPGAWSAVSTEPTLLRHVVDEVARHDPSIQNTRRYAHAEGAEVCGRHIEPGQAVLLLLAAANRDAAANPQPDVFRLDRTGRRHHGFGAGAHQCPGQALAAAIAEAALRALPQAAIDTARGFLLRPVYRASVNARIPQFHRQETP